MKHTGLLVALAWGSACVSTSPPTLPGHGEAFAGIELQFET